MRVVGETWEIVPLPIYAMVAMLSHWHFVVRPETSDQVSEFFRLLAVMHTMRWHAHYKTSGTGHLYQGRFKSFPIQTDGHLLTVMRYVERNLHFCFLQSSRINPKAKYFDDREQDAPATIFVVVMAGMYWSLCTSKTARRLYPGGITVISR